MHETLGPDGKVFAIVPIGGIMLLILMYTLTSSADAYLSPSLEFIAVKLKMSESLAGVTLLALGNGAPDVFAAISASNGDGEGSEQVLFSIVYLVGCSLFISSFLQVVTVRTTSTRSVKVTPVFFIRDLSIYMLMMIYLLLIMTLMQQINLILTIGFLFMYVVYVAIVII